MYSIDGVTVKSPHEIDTEYNTISEDERAIDTGDAISLYVNVKHKVTWRYKWITQSELNKITNIVIKGDKLNKNRFHRITTFDTATGSMGTYTVYCSATLKLKPYMKKDGEYVYKDVEITWIEK